MPIQTSTQDTFVESPRFTGPRRPGTWKSWEHSWRPAWKGQAEIAKAILKAGTSSNAADRSRISLCMLLLLTGRRRLTNHILVGWWSLLCCCRLKLTLLLVLEIWTRVIICLSRRDRDRDRDREGGVGGGGGRVDHTALMSRCDATSAGV